MSTSPDTTHVTAAAERAFAAEATPEQAAALALRVDRELVPHPRLPDHERVYVELSDSALTVHAGSFLALREAHPDIDLDDEVETHVAIALEDAAAGPGALEAEDALFAQHARYRRGEDLPHAWYRAGTPIDAHIWAVDLDVFCEVWISRHEWPALVRGRLPIRLGEDVLDIELPEDADPTEVLTLEGAGLFEDEIYADEPLPDAGDLHLILFVI